MTIRKLQAERAELRYQYEARCAEIDHEIDALRKKRNPNWKVEQDKKFQNDANWVYMDAGRNELPTHNGAPQ